ncbi:uncharacterized protein LOC127715540 isoform X1 [Mytilus californianus]|uniref:uncharacterized protein LOC127715540 isoform X1 n=1 Tax=Mytilus californianus TaxID=6549 RepID=UPI00224629AA|nr:uncharacterized protein LOC127715540 isoform X1 [Mytilus californianus]XP_052077588.1 uncharacterized protein LOC127715540 isoform X1 [Mytilus californianus]
MSYKIQDTHSRTVGPGRASNLYDFLSPSSESTYNRATSPHDERSRFDTHSKPITRREFLSRDHQPSPTISNEGETNEHDRHDRITTTRKVYLSHDKQLSPNVAIENDRTKRRSPRESSHVDQLLTLVKDLQKVDIDTIESSLKDTSTEQLKLELQKQKEEYNTLKEVYDEFKKKYQEAVDQNDEIITKAKQLIKDAKQKARTDSEETIKKLKMRLKEKDVELTNLKSEKDSALSRLSKEMGDKLSENNAGIADLSDPNRSTKLAEKYNNLYDNDWTDALESLTTESRVDEEAGVRFLLEIMKHASSFCKRAHLESLQSLECILSNPVSPIGHATDSSAQSGADKQIWQMLETCVKLKAKTAILNLQKSYMASSRKPIYAERLPEYVNKCIEICWLMNTHNPPLEFAEPPMSGQPYDKDSYKEFTKQGDTVSFVVWLPLLIEKDGPVLTKGVVQPIPKSFSTSVSKTKRNISADKMKVRGRQESESERRQRLLHNKEVERKDVYEHNQLKETESRFNDLLRENQHQHHDTTDLRKKYEEEIDRPGLDKNDHRVNEMFHDSPYRPYSSNTRSTTATSASAYKYSPSSEPASENYSSYGQHGNYNRPHSAFTERHTEYDYKHQRPKTAGVESKGNPLTYFDPKSAEIYEAGRTKYALYHNQLYVHDSDSNTWRPSSGFNT